MSLIAGIVSRNGTTLPESACAELMQSVSRTEAQADCFQDQHSCFLKVDFGTFGAPGCVIDVNGSLSLVTGEPLLADRCEELSCDRHRDLATIHRELLRNNYNILRKANGTFSLVHYDPQTSTLRLIADKAGVRPLYFWCDDRLAVFASALRILEACPFVPKKLDIRGATELIALGYPLGGRTAYADISVLRPAQVININQRQIASTTYWRWDEIETVAGRETEHLNDVYQSFRNAVFSRIRNDKETAAYLSGGLDSRCVVATLRERCIKTHTVNFATVGTQDHDFGNAFAQAIGSAHLTIPRNRGNSSPDYSRLMADALADRQLDLYPGRARLVWSGEGGSVLLGCVHLNASLVELMRQGRTSAAIDEYLQNEGGYVPEKFIQRSLLPNLREVVKQGIAQELERFDAPDAGRNFYLFLMQNDQARKLSTHFEDLDLHRLEFQLPFFDGWFLECVFKVPIDLCLNHKFYVQLLLRFPAEVNAIPWQSYPEHEPCPLLAANTLTSQWDIRHQARDQSANRHSQRSKVLKLLWTKDFPKQIINRRKLAIAAGFHLIGYRDYGYAIDAAHTYYKYARKCAGQINLSHLDSGH